MAVLFELSSNASLNPFAYFNKARWKGKVGWGPRFQGWEDCLQNHTELEFNAMQWVESVKAAKSKWDILKDKNKIEIRYEELITQPETTLYSILNVLECEADDSFFNTIPALNKTNFNKWRKEFSVKEKEQIHPILSPLLDELGYLKAFPW